MRRGVLALAATLAVAVTGCGSTSGGFPFNSAPTNPDLRDPATHARAEADRLLGLIRVPSSATPAGHSPANALDQASQTTATNDIVDEHRWWTISWDAQRTLDWLTNNGVEHLKSSGTGTSGGPEGVTEYTLIFNAKAPTGIDSEEVQLDVAPMSDGTSAIRADAQVVWLVNRPADETIPGNIARIDVSASNAGKQIGQSTLTGGKARRLARVINALPTAPRAEHSCGMDTGYTLHVVAGPLVFDADVACSDILVKNNGKQLPVLTGDQKFVHAVASSMGLPDYPYPVKERPSRPAR